MPRLPLTALSLTFALGMSGCAANGQAVRPTACPKLGPAPPSLMQPSNAGEKVRQILFDSPTSGTPKSAPSKTPSDQTERDKALSQLAKDLAEMHRVIQEANRRPDRE